MSRQLRDNVTATKEPYSPTEPSTFETTSPECLIFNHGKWEGSEKPAGDKLGQHWSHRKHSTTRQPKATGFWKEVLSCTIFNLSNSYLQNLHSINFSGQKWCFPRGRRAWGDLRFGWYDPACDPKNTAGWQRFSMSGLRDQRCLKCVFCSCLLW